MGLIFWHCRRQMQAAWVALTHGLTTRFRYPWWAYLLLPAAAIGLELLGTLPQLLYFLVSKPVERWRSTWQLVASAWAHLSS